MKFLVVLLFSALAVVGYAQNQPRRILGARQVEKVKLSEEEELKVIQEIEKIIAKIEDLNVQLAETQEEYRRAKGLGPKTLAVMKAQQIRVSIKNEERKKSLLVEQLLE